MQKRISSPKLYCVFYLLTDTLEKHRPVISYVRRRSTCKWSGKSSKHVYAPCLVILARDTSLYNFLLRPSCLLRVYTFLAFLKRVYVWDLSNYFNAIANFHFYLSNFLLQIISCRYWMKNALFWSSELYTRRFPTLIFLYVEGHRVINLLFNIRKMVVRMKIND